MQTVSEPYKHGTMRTYWHGCRCLSCRMEASAYAQRERCRQKDGTADYVVSPELASKHLWSLSRQGMGLRAVEECTGIGRGRLGLIRARRTRIRQSTEVRILRVSAHSLKSAGAWTYARRANRRVDEMLAAGWSKMRIARAMGYKGQRLEWHGRTRIRVSTEVKFMAVYRAFKRAQIREVA